MPEPLRWTSRLIQALYAQGVRHAVISPGSRSTPLTIAAAIHPGIKKKVVLDERSAGFIALGIGKAGGTPALLICTSGTAVANYFPAIIEAKESGTPMIVLSADRPPNLRGIGSSQTIDQVKLFGDQAVFFHEAGEPATGADDLHRIEFLAKQAVNASIQKGGAAHINLPFRKPLEPTANQLHSAIKESEKSTEDALQSTPPAIRTIRLSDDIQHLIKQSRKPLIIAGPANRHCSLKSKVQQLSTRLSAPVLAEPGSGLADGELTINRFTQILIKETQRKNLQPDLILRFGDQPFTRPLLSAFDSWKSVPVVQFLARDAWQDHSMAAAYRILLHPNDEIDLSWMDIKTGSDWLSLWTKADHKSTKTLEEKLNRIEPLTDGHVFHHISRSLPASWNVMLSNSFPVRDMAYFGRSKPGQFVNRGAAGIDGILSTAIGISQATETPVCCMLGDLAFLHDSNALYTLKSSEKPVVAVIINNGGGTIFRKLPIYTVMTEQGKADLYTTYFETPQDVEIQFLANASGIPYRRISDLQELRSLDFETITTSTVVECITNAGESMKLRESL